MRTSATLAIIISLFLSTAPVSAAVTTSSTQTTTSTTASSTLCTTLTKTLKYKISKDSTTGGEVSKLQNFFKAQGLYKAIPNGIFGSLTLKTVKSFQKKYGLKVTGQVDSKTRAKIRQLSCGSGSSVGSTSDTAKSTKTTTGKEKTTKTTTSSKGGGSGSAPASTSTPTLTSTPAGSIPKVFWSSFPIKPNETVLFRGDNFANTGILMPVGQLSNTDPGSPLDKLLDPTFSQEISPLQSSIDSAAFTLPKSFALGMYAYKIKNASTGIQSKTEFLNKPDPWFYMANNGNSATPGGWIEIYGRSISITPSVKPLIALVSEGGVVYKAVASVSSSNNYSARFPLPADLPEGTYTIYQHNGYGGQYGWTKFEWHGKTIVKNIQVKKAITWPTEVFEIAMMTGTTTDDKIASAVALAKANGGGVIHFPAGAYNLTKPMILPNKTLVKGDGKDNTFIRWSGEITDSRTGGAGACAGTMGTFALVTSDYIRYSSETGSICSSFSIEDVTLGHTTSDNYICIKRAYTENEKAWFKRIACVSPNKPENTVTGKGFGLWMRKTINTEISDSTFDYRYGMYFNGDGSSNSFVRVERNTLRWRFAPYYVINNNNAFVINENRLIMADNEVINGMLTDPVTQWDAGEGYGSFNGNIRDIYFANNVSSREDLSPIPSKSPVDMTFDGTNGAYFGKVDSVSGVTMNLTGVTNGTDIYGHAPVSKGAIVQIVSGKGMGQSRVLQSPATSVSTIEIDEPWGVEPDSTSWINISDYLGRFLFVGNTFTNHPRIQFYFPTSDIIFSNNTIGVNGPKTILNLWAGKSRSTRGFATGMYFQVLDNKITKGGMRHMNLVNALEKLPPEYKGYTGLSQIYRNNVSDGAPFTMEPNLSLDGILIENNKALVSINFKKPTVSTGVTIKGNEITPGVPTQVDIDGEAIIIPTAKVLGASTQCVQLPSNLHRGMESSQVTLLQNFLHEQGFLDVTATGFYGDKTVNAVKDYQASNSIKQTGMVYDLTRKSIREHSCQ